MSSSNNDTAKNLQKYKEHLENLAKQRDLDFALSLEQPPIILDDIDEELELGADKPQFLMFQVNPAPRKTAKSENEKEEEEPEPPQTICIAIILGPDGKVLAYSIGLNGFSDEFHDVSDLNISLGAFTNQLHGTLGSTLKGGGSVDQAIDAVRNQFPGSRTYKDTPMQTRANEQFKKWCEKNDKPAAKENEATAPSITPFNTTPKPW
ncbi:hypothetical protein BN59_01624 [Legionella massiliensis]|uniref:Uncharacterized protein n=1 Tax=Legionella massiliensis TaxID=1034943 RepID=A0A078KWH4_9GAMM|nr:hypothetical protein [Legionella massiliensis]CDZ77341.1 hypothetical protein BN59_01624 [Legionella massiliensis]CEE13079.1 hypothetical protein BN1094_01624 [Legionella massiliensis]